MERAMLYIVTIRFADGTSVQEDVWAFSAAEACYVAAGMYPNAVDIGC